MESGDFKPVMGTVIQHLKQIERNTNNNACCTASTSAGTDTSVPAGFRSVTITQTVAGMVVITMSDGTTYTLSGVGQSLPITAPVFQSLPAFPVSASGGGAWQWIGLN